MLADNPQSGDALARPDLEGTRPSVAVHVGLTLGARDDNYWLHLSIIDLGGPAVTLESTFGARSSVGLDPAEMALEMVVWIERAKRYLTPDIP